MEPQYRNGSIFVSSMCKADYLTTFFLGLVIFSGLFFFIDVICAPMDWYARRTKKDRFEIREMIMTNIHHFVVVANSFRNIYYMCPHAADTTWSHFKWFDSEICYQQVHEGSVHNLMIAMSYLVVDYFAIKHFVPNPSKTQ